MNAIIKQRVNSKYMIVFLFALQDSAAQNLK